MSDFYLINVRMYGTDGVFFGALSRWVHTHVQKGLEQPVVCSAAKFSCTKDRTQASSYLTLVHFSDAME